MTFTAVQFTGLTSLLAVWAGLGFEIALGLVAVTTIIYTAIAGIKSDFYTDAVHFWVILLVFGFILSPAAWSETDGPRRLATLLAVVGIFGVMSYSVTMRTREIGLRMALGAQPGEVLRLILRQGFLLTLIGIGLGIVGALALNAYGYLRATVDVDVLLTREGLQRFRSAVLGRGYSEKFPGSRGLRDTARKVDIDVVLAGDYPGDGREKPVAFPDPAVAAVKGETYALLALETLIELKIASGMTAPHRLRDLADVIELIRVNALPSDYRERLHPYVRDRFAELWQAAQVTEPE